MYYAKFAYFASSYRNYDSISLYKISVSISADCISQGCVHNYLYLNIFPLPFFLVAVPISAFAVKSRATKSLWLEVRANIEILIVVRPRPRRKISIRLSIRICSRYVEIGITCMQISADTVYLFE